MTSKINCICNTFEKIDEFCSIGEFERFQKYIEELVKGGDLIEVLVQAGLLFMHTTMPAIGHR